MLPSDIARLRTTCAAMTDTATSMRPLVRGDTTSDEKVENVVSPQSL